MTTCLKKTVFTALVVGAVSGGGQPARAWNPPDGPTPDHIYAPASATTLLPKAHGYIIQNGITILENDGYWVAAQTMRQGQRELLNGVRYADLYQGSQCVNVDVCLLEVLCEPLGDPIKCWPYAADNHYYNPDTGYGLQAGYLADAAEWTQVVEDIVGAVARIDVQVDPILATVYPSAIDWINTEFANAISAYRGGSPPSINGRHGTQLAMFYLGWASHFMQDQNVMHHTYDEVLKHHAEYENWADADTSQTPPVWNRAFTAPPDPTGLTGIYSASPGGCTPVGSPRCLALNANWLAHQQDMWSIDDEYSNAPDDSVGGTLATAAVRTAIPIAERTQAGFYFAFLSSAGQPPVQMPAVLRVLNAS